MKESIIKDKVKDWLDWNSNRNSNNFWRFKVEQIAETETKTETEVEDRKQKIKTNGKEGWLTNQTDQRDNRQKKEKEKRK